jgi:hypothetical protein
MEAIAVILGQREMEARVGVEPTYKGFADLAITGRTHFVSALNPVEARFCPALARMAARYSSFDIVWQTVVWLGRIEVMLGEDLRHPLAIVQALAYYRHQKLQGRLRRNLSLAHPPLDGFRQNFHQRQSPRYTAHTAVEPARQLIRAVAKALLQLRQQPAHLQCGRGLVHRPHNHFHRVPAQLLQSDGPLAAIAIYDSVAVRLALGCYHYYGRLLAQFRQGRQQPPLPRRMAESQVLPATVEMVKFQLPALGRTEVLQGTSPRTDKSLVAARPIAGMLEKPPL